MNLGKIVNLFKNNDAPVTQKPISGETAMAGSSMYGSSDWPQYNPDELMRRLGNTIYSKIMRDDQVKVVVKFRRNAVTSRNWSFVLDTDKLPEKEVEHRINLCDEILRRMQGTFKKKLDGVMTSLHNGFSLSEKTYELFDFEGQQYYGIHNIRLKPFQTFDFYIDEFGNLTKLRQIIGGKESPNLDFSKFIHHTHNSEEHEFYGSSELREVYRDWFSKDMCYRNQNIWLERCAAGFLTLTPEGEYVIQKNSAEYNDLVAMMRNIKTNTAMLLPKGMKAEIHSFKDTEAYDRALNRFDKAIAKSLLMPNMLGMSGDNKGGSRALGDTQLEAFLWMLDSEADDLQETINEQLFKELGDLNWGDGLYPVFTLAPLSDAQKFKTATAWGDLIQKGAVTKSDSDEKHFREMLEIPEKDEASATGLVDDNKTKPDETIIGQNILKAGFARSVRRVNFVAIDSSSNIIIFTATNDVSRELSEGVDYLVDNLPEGDDLDFIRKINFRSSTHTAIRKAFTAMLQDGWKVGKVNGGQELRKSLGKNEALLSRFKFERLEDKAAEYFKEESFRMTGDLTSATLSIIRNELLNGVKYSKSPAQIKVAIFERLATEGMMDEEVMLQALGEALGTKNTTHRIETVVRTNTFAAINEARFSLFTDPDLNGFVEALQYSAILDSRVTAVCSELDDKIFPLTSENWEKYRPPNHYNCRSLLVVITTRDVWQTSPNPTIDPQKGFA